MNATEQRNLLRRGVIRAATYAANNGGFGVDVRSLQDACRGVGKPVPEADVLAAIAYLVSEGLLEEKPRKISRALKLWQITSKGIDYAEEEGLDG